MTDTFGALSGPIKPIDELVADARRDERIMVLRGLAAEIADDTYPMCPDSWSSMLDDRADALEKGTGPLLPIDTTPREFASDRIARIRCTLLRDLAESIGITWGRPPPEDPMLPEWHAGFRMAIETVERELFQRSSAPENEKP